MGKFQSTRLFFRWIAVWVMMGVTPLMPGVNVPQSAPHYAGLVIDFGDVQPPQTYCVPFTESSISGYDLLVRAGVDFEAAFDNTGSAVCAIEDVGCAVDSCLTCQIPKYWSYWHRDGDTWVYSTIGSDAYQVTDGAVEGWVWGVGDASPPQISLAQICESAPTDTATPSPEPEPTATPTADGGSNAVITSGSPASPTLEPTQGARVLKSDPTPTAKSPPARGSGADTDVSSRAGGPVGYWVFAGLLIALGAGYFLMQRQAT
jgi:hypothetical protein